MSRLVRLYPRAWRARYEDEFLRLIEDRPPSLAGQLDIIRGALDARLHPQIADVSEPMPWTHRVPGLLSLSAGLCLCLAVLGVSFGPGSDWGAAGSFLGAAMMLMLTSLPGDYLGRVGRPVPLGLGLFAATIVIVNLLGWGVPASILGFVAALGAICGLVATAALRAGIAARGRWIVVAGAVLLPLLLVSSMTLIRETLGITLFDVTASTTALLGLPYGIAWLLVGLRMTVRGSATIIDPPVGASGGVEVPAS